MLKSIFIIKIFFFVIHRNENISLPAHSNVLQNQFWWEELNETEKHDAIEKILGPKQRHESGKLEALTTYYCGVIVVGVLGNALSAWAIASSRDLLSPQNLFIFNLAVADLMTLLLGEYY